MKSVQFFKRQFLGATTYHAISTSEKGQVTYSGPLDSVIGMIKRDGGTIRPSYADPSRASLPEEIFQGNLMPLDLREQARILHLLREKIRVRQIAIKHEKIAVELVLSEAIKGATGIDLENKLAEKFEYHLSLNPYLSIGFYQRALETVERQKDREELPVFDVVIINDGGSSIDADRLEDAIHKILGRKKRT